MAKKCIICGNTANLCIKGSSESYCNDCAEENFADASLLVKVEEEAQKLKDVISRRAEPEDEEKVK